MRFDQLYTQAGNTSLVNDVILGKQAVNDAIREIITEIGANFTESAALALTNNVFRYSLTTLLPLPPLKIHFVTYTSISSPQSASELMPVPMSQMLQLQGIGNTAVGSVRTYAVGDFDAIYFYPTPVTGDTVRFYYTADFADITSDVAVTALVPPHLHYCIVYLAARNLAIINNAQMVAELEPLAQSGLSKVKEYANTRRATRPMRARVGNPRGFYVTDRSQYYTGME